MKEATGELNMTVITILLIGAVLTFAWILWDKVKAKIENQWNNVDKVNSEQKGQWGKTGYHYTDDHSIEYAGYIMNW